MTAAPAVTVVIPTHNRRDTVLSTVRMALAQRDVDVEVVVVDDGSSDGTSKALAQLDDERLRVIRHDVAQNVAGARNAGIAAARAPWIALLDDDDRWPPDKLRVQLDAADRSGADFVYGSALTVDLAGHPEEVWEAPSPDELHRHIRRQNQVPAGSSNIMISRSLLDRAGVFDPRLHHLADWDLWIRLAENGRGAQVSQLVVGYVVHGGNMHVTDTMAAFREARLVAAKHRRSPLPGRFGLAPFLHWIASGYLGAGRRRLAFLGYLGAALTARTRSQARRSAFSALRTLGVRRPRRRTAPSPTASPPAPELAWSRPSAAPEQP